MERPRQHGGAEWRYRGKIFVCAAFSPRRQVRVGTAVTVGWEDSFLYRRWILVQGTLKRSGVFLFPRARTDGLIDWGRGLFSSPIVSLVLCNF